MTKTVSELAAITEEVQSADMGIIIGVAIAAVLVLGLIAYLIYRFVLDPHVNKKDSFVGPNYTAGGQRDHYVGGSQNIYRYVTGRPMQHRLCYVEFIFKIA